MEDLVGVITQLGIFCGLIMLGLIAGRRAERKHLRSLERRERALEGMLVTDLKCYPGGVSPELTPQMIVGEVSIASDYLKTLLAGLRNLIGGEVRSFETLQLRARREAILRIMEQAKTKGYNAIGNLRLESADIGGNVVTNRKQKMVVTSIIASGTAYVRA